MDAATWRSCVRDYGIACPNSDKGFGFSLATVVTPASCCIAKQIPRCYTAAAPSGPQSIGRSSFWRRGWRLGMEKYDLIVIGSGPAGQRAAIQAAKFGKHVALVEKLEVVGGVAINTGTIPSKTMREAVLHLSGFYYQNIYGVNYRVKEKITMADLSFRAQHVIKTEIDVIRGAAFAQRHRGAHRHRQLHRSAPHSRGQLANNQSDYEAANVIIATGTKPAESALVPFNDRTIINSDQILGMPEIPKTLHGGRRRRDRRRVHVHVRDPRRAGDADREASAAAGICRFRDGGGALLSPARPPRDDAAQRRSRECRGDPDGGVVAVLKSKKKVSGDALLYAVGRQGNVDELNLAAAGLEADSRGRIPVDENYRTKQPHIFAVGDVIGFPSLGSVSMEQGRIAAANAFDIPIHSNRANYPYGIYTIPEISFIGKTEEQLTEEGVPYEVGVAFFREIARGQIRGDTTGRLKLIFDPDTKQMLGVHIVGEGATRAAAHRPSGLRT